MLSNQSVVQTVTVSEISNAIKSSLEYSFASVSVMGELSNVHRHSSGHFYFTLKDQNAQLSAVMFRGNAMKLFFKPDNGMEVICTGGITVYEPRGVYQLMVTGMIPRGEGALQVLFEKLKTKLSAEGLFDTSRKHPLPKFPRKIALVTSKAGAAIKDMISVIHRRNSSIEILVVPTQVQGAGAAEQIAAGIDLCNEFAEVDLILIGRGGGSIEDLWAFNEEIVAYAIARSKIPVISAVGHEVDFTIADFVADCRAATPSVAGEIAVPLASTIVRELKIVSDTLWKLVDSKAGYLHQELKLMVRNRVLRTLSNRWNAMALHVDDVSEQLEHAIDLYMERKDHCIGILRERLLASDPSKILKKGYAIIRKDKRIIDSITEITLGDTVEISLRDGSASANITKRHFQ